MRSIHKARVPVVVMSCLLGAFASVACGESDPDGKTGGGLAASPGKGGSVNVGVGGSSTGGKGGASGTAGVVSVGGASGTSGTSGTSGASSGTSGSGGACVSTSKNSNKTEVALLFMVDISGSMNCKVPEVDPPCEVDPNMTYTDTRWTEMKPALDAFFNDPNTTGMWVGINFFSKGGSCNVTDYETPVAEIALLPGAASGLNQAVDGQKPQGSTPTVPSLQGALNHAETWAAAHADQNVVVVYATDGYPMGCNGNTIDNAAAAAKKSYTGPHQIRTYVLGVGPNLTDLNTIAVSGGTDAAIQIDTGQTDVTQQLTDKFNAIRSEVAVDCQYTVPDPPAGQVIDPNAVNVTYTSGGMTVTIPFDDTGTCMKGWKYADATNKQVVLCGSSCDDVKAAATGVRVEFGCSTVTIGMVK